MTTAASKKQPSPPAPSIEADALLRIATAGSVDDGKSTLIGRMLFDSDAICEDHLKGLYAKNSTPGSALELAYVTDGLKSEREQGITIDVAYRYFSTPRRHFILADAPGHEQYTRNMVTAVSTADVIIILIDAVKGVTTQTKRHSCIGSLMGVPHFLVVINKMDLMNYDKNHYDMIRNSFLEFADNLPVKDIRFIPISALSGDNVVHQSSRMNWYTGQTVLQYLEDTYIGGNSSDIDFRFPVQYVIRSHEGFRGYAGQVSSGSVKIGDKVICLPSRTVTSVSSLYSAKESSKLSDISEATSSQSIVMKFTDEIDISRGDIIARLENPPRVTNNFDATIVWMGDSPLELSKLYILKHTTREVKAHVSSIEYGIEINTNLPKVLSQITKNEVARIKLACTEPICIDDYRLKRATGSFILIDPDHFATVAAGMIIEQADSSLQGSSKSDMSSQLHSETSHITTAEREHRNKHKAYTIWLTGLSGAGKSTIARMLEKALFLQEQNAYCLDGDNIRQGLNKDLGFSLEDRSENIRRVAEVAALFNKAGITVICSFISPMTEDRALAKKIIGPDRFLEVFVNASLKTCEQRDPHGLYKKARIGEIKLFTGISSPYEEPKAPWVTINTETCSIEEGIKTIFSAMSKLTPSSD